jgi:predicted enzyme related to lactoylglutathione lyase
MTSSILNVTFDFLNAEGLARFWSEVTGWPLEMVDMPGNPFWVVGNNDGTSTRLVFVNVHEVKGSKNRLHLDLLPRDTTQTAELTRFESMGARIVDDRRNLEPGGWVVMADPEGNEFCLENGDL